MPGWRGAKAGAAKAALPRFALRRLGRQGRLLWPGGLVAGFRALPGLAAGSVKRGITGGVLPI